MSVRSTIVAAQRAVPLPVDVGLLEHVLESLSVGVALLDSETRVVTFNSWLLRATGLRLPAVQGQLWSAVFPRLDHGRLAAALRGALEGGAPQILSHVAVGPVLPLHGDERARSEGEALPHDVQVIPLLFGEHRYCMLQVTDVSFAATREQALTDSLSEARQARSSQRAFLARMSHEIRTPMNGIIALSELLLTEDLPTDHRETLQVIYNSSHSLLSIINDVLDFSKIDAGKMTVNKAASDVPRLVHEVEAVLGLRAKEKGVGIQLSLPKDLPTVVIDELRTRQVLLNLVSNAIKFTEQQGRVQIGVRWNSTSGTRGRLYFSVRDTGIGVAEPGQLFRDYAQADSTISQRFGGTGLGLSISKQLVELMGGEIGVESRLGDGSYFWFQMPAEVAPEAATESVPVSATVPKVSGRVLVVDDNRVNQLVATKILQRMGYHVTTADNGLVALSVMDEGLFDLVFMDCLMPVMDGYEATKQLRQRGFTNVPIVAVTAGAVEGDRELCLQAGMTDYVSKPFTIKAISSLLERLRVNAA